MVIIIGTFKFAFCIKKDNYFHLFYFILICRSVNSNSENRDSGVADIDLGPLPSPPVRNPKHPDDTFENSSPSQQATPKRAALTVT